MLGECASHGDRTSIYATAKGDDIFAELRRVVADTTTHDGAAYAADHGTHGAADD